MTYSFASVASRQGIALPDTTRKEREPICPHFPKIDLFHDNRSVIEAGHLSFGLRVLRIGLQPHVPNLKRRIKWARGETQGGKRQQNQQQNGDQPD